MNPGELRDRASFSQLADTLPDDYGESEEVWTRYMSRWVADEPLRGRELFQAKQAQSLVNHRIKMRYSSRVKPQHRLEVSGRTLQVDSVIDLKNRNHEMHLMCTEQIDV